MPAKTATPKIWTDEERAAAQASVKERQTAAKRNPANEREDGERDVRAKFADMPPADRKMGERIHELVLGAVPDLVPKTYYGMPAYAKDGKTIAFFKPASKFKVRYASFEFQPDAHIDAGNMWPISYAVIELTPKVEAHIVELVKKAVS
jgi:uncharacterized protein YdhG (YjbR/CyaY superfamily)